MGDLKYKKKHKELGLCKDCSRPADSGAYCIKHRIRNNKKNKRDVGRASRLRRRYKQQNRCTRCGQPLDEDADKGHVKCINCRMGL